MFQTILKWLVPSTVLMSGQMDSTSFNEQSGKEEKLRYSAYSEMEYRHDDRKLFVRFVCTFGLERLPKEHIYNGLDKKKYREWMRDGLVPWVGEIYFLNYGDQNIQVKPVSLSLMDQKIDFTENFDIAPRGMGITQPLVMLHSNFGTELDVEFCFEYERKAVEIKGIAKRMTVEEIKVKYSN